MALGDGEQYLARGGYILLKFRVFKLELAVGCNTWQALPARGAHGVQRGAPLAAAQRQCQHGAHHGPGHGGVVRGEHGERAQQCVRAVQQGLTLVPIFAQLSLTLPVSAQLKLTLSPI